MEAFAALRATDPSQVGPYRLLGRLGSGGMGSVYLGRSRGGRTVAVKVVRADLAEETGFRRRFAREIAAARRVNGAFTAGVVDADPDGEPPWLATAYVPGMALDAAVDAHGPWPLGPVLALGAGLAEALTEIHAVGVVHRDLKPSNILLSQDGPRVIDFGISAVSEATLLTQAGAIIGTPGFMSPEQLTGEKTGPAGDVFALGAVLVYAATGQGPFGGGSSHAVQYRTVYEAARTDGVPAALREVVAACLEKDRARRPGVEQVLERLLSLGAEDGGDHCGAAAGVPEEIGNGWLPPLIAETVLSIAEAAARPGAPSPAPAAAASRAAESPRTGSASAGAAQGTQPPARPARITRRRALLGLTGAAAVAGLGVGGWVIGTRHDDGHRPAAPRRAGTLRWKTDRLTAASGLGNGDRSAPLTAADGLVYAADNQSLLALSATRGVRKWRYLLDEVDTLSETTGATVAGGAAYFGVGNSVHAVHVATGKRLWTMDTDGNDVGVGQPVLRDGSLYILGYGAYQDSVYRVSAKTGDIEWKKPEESQTRFVGSAGIAVALAGDTAYTHNGGVVVARRTDSGAGSWQYDTKVTLQKTPVVADGTCFACGSDDASDVRFVYALAADTGKVRWKVRFAGGMDPDSNIEGIRAVSGGVALLYTGTSSSDAGLRALDTKNGTVKWQRRLDTTVLSPPAVAGGTIYIAADDSLYALHIDTGKTLWRSSLGTLTRERPVVTDDTVYLSSTNGKIYAVWV